MQLKDAIKGRKQSKRYAKKKPNWRHIIQSIDAARYAPAAGNLFTTKFLLISDKAVIEQIRAATQQDFVSAAHFLVVIATDDAKMIKTYQDRGLRYASTQAGAAIQNFMLEITEKKLVTYWVRYFDEEQIKEITGIPESWTIEGIFPVGVEGKPEAKPEEKPELENLVFFEKWKQKTMTLQPKVRHENV